MRNVVMPGSKIGQDGSQVAGARETRGRGLGARADKRVEAEGGKAQGSWAQPLRKGCNCPKRGSWRGVELR